MIEYLKWESDFFNCKIGKATLDSPDIETLLAEKRKEEYERIFFFSEERDHVVEKQIAEYKGYLADTKVIYHRMIKGASSKIGGIEEYNGKLTDELKLLAIQSGHESRFRKDSLLSPLFEKMYITWIEQCIKRKLADVVLVHKINSHIKAFVTLQIQKKTGIIGLIAVDESLRGQGVGTSLINASVNWLFNQGCTNMEVATQSENIGACRFYEQSGFYIKEKKYIYHL